MSEGGGVPRSLWHPRPVKELKDGVAVVTGAAGGIGAAVARKLTEEGMQVILVDRDGAALASLAATLPGSEADPLDVGDAAAFERLAGRIRARGGFDLLVSNAGINVHGAFLDQSIEDLDRIVRVNLMGVLYGCRLLVPELRRGGHVVNVSSLAGRVPFPYQSTYCATKFAVRGFTAALRMELAPRGIGVTAVLPGTVATRLLETATTYDATAASKMASLMLAYGMPPARVAEEIVRAIRGDVAEVMIGWDAKLTTAASSLAPGLVSGALSRGFRWRASKA